VFVGIDCHKHRHAAALIDARGGLIDTLLFSNRPDGYRELIGWLVDHDAASALVGIENPAGFGRPLTTALAGAGFVVLNVPAWRTHRDRRRIGPGKTDPGDAHAIAQVVMRARDELGCAQEPELVHAARLLELQRHRMVRDRTQAIQRLRSTWQQIDPVAEAAALRCDRQHQLRRLKRIRFGDGLANQIAARCIRQLAADIEALNQRIAELDAEIADLLDEHGNPVADLLGAGNQIAASLIAHAGDVRAFETPLLSRASVAPRRFPAAQDKPPVATDCIAEATDSSTPRSTASRSSNNDTTPTPRPFSLARPPKARPHAKHDAPSSATSPTSSTGAFTPGRTPARACSS
jgi:transposase